MRPWFAALFIVVAPVFARADAVPAPRTQCPDGARARPYHWGEACEPLDCTTDADCDKNMECVDAPLCIETGTHPTGSGKTVTGACSTDTSCAPPATCSTSNKRCANRGLLPRYRSRCGCGVPGEGADAWWVFALACALAARKLFARSAPRDR